MAQTERVTDRFGRTVILTDRETVDTLQTFQALGWREVNGVGYGTSAWTTNPRALRAVDTIVKAVGPDGVSRQGGVYGVCVCTAEEWDTDARYWRDGTDMTRVFGYSIHFDGKFGVRFAG